MTKTQTTNDKPHNAYFSGARLLAPVLFGAAMLILSPGGAGAAADDTGQINTIGGDVYAPAAGTFADTRRALQLRVLSQWQDAISQKAEGALTKEFSAIKKADIHIQTSTGERKGNLGAHIIGAFADNADSAFGWQVRAYAAEDSVKGANAGLFARSVSGGFLIGGNIFADYEDGGYGEFTRYGVGAEAQNKFFAANANYYIPSTGENPKDGTIAF